MLHKVIQLMTFLKLCIVWRHKSETWKQENFSRYLRNKTHASGFSRPVNEFQFRPKHKWITCELSKIRKLKLVNCVTYIEFTSSEFNLFQIFKCKIQFSISDKQQKFTLGAVHISRLLFVILNVDALLFLDSSVPHRVENSPTLHTGRTADHLTSETVRLVFSPWF